MVGERFIGELDERIKVVGELQSSSLSFLVLGLGVRTTNSVDNRTKPNKLLHFLPQQLLKPRLITPLTNPLPHIPLHLPPKPLTEFLIKIRSHRDIVAFLICVDPGEESECVGCRWGPG